MVNAGLTTGAVSTTVITSTTSTTTTSTAATTTKQQVRFTRTYWLRSVQEVHSLFYKMQRRASNLALKKGFHCVQSPKKPCTKTHLKHMQ